HLIVIDGLGAVVPDLVRLVVLDHAVHIFFRVDIELLGALQVLEADLVEIGLPTALGAATLDAALGGTLRQPIGRHGITVINPAGDDRPVRITLQESHDDFLSDAWHLDHAPVLAGPHLRHPDPTGTLLVL